MIGWSKDGKCYVSCIYVWAIIGVYLIADMVDAWYLLLNAIAP